MLDPQRDSTNLGSVLRTRLLFEARVMYRSMRRAFLLSILALVPPSCARPARDSCVDGSPTAAAAAEPGSLHCSPLTTPLVGTICLPTDRTVRHPAIVLLGGYPGGDPMRHWAQDFAARGYVAESLAYFGAPGLRTTLVDVPVEIAGSAIAALAARADVDDGRIGVLGISKGGEYALLVASTYPDVKAVVAVVPAPFAWFGMGEGGAPEGCSWSRQGHTLPCVSPDPSAGRRASESMMAGGPVSFRESYEWSRRRQDLVREAMFPLERIQGPVLCLAGDDDQVWNSRAHCELTMDYLARHQHGRADRMISFADAGHLFWLAQRGPASARNSAAVHGFQVLFGGTPDADARAASAAWLKIRDFLAGELDGTGRASGAPRP